MKIILFWKTLLNRLEKSIGDSVTLISPDQGIRASKMIISDFFKIGLHQVDSKFIIMNKQTAQNVFQLEGYVSGFRVYLKDPSIAEKTASTIGNIFGDTLEIYPWTIFNQQFFLALKSQNESIRNIELDYNCGKL